MTTELTPQAPPEARNSGIDALRGLAILLVVVHHIALRIPLKQTALVDILPRRVLGALGFNGYEAVFVFFVISGFLITTHALARWGSLSRIDARDFYARRAARILPCLLMLMLVLSGLHLAGLDDYTIHREGQSLIGTIMSALGLYLNWYEGQTGWLPGSWDVLWSLSIEEVFYLGFPIVCLLVRDRRVLGTLLVVLALSLPFTRAALAGNDIWQEKAYLPGMAAIAMGVLSALLAQKYPPNLARARLLIGSGGIGVVAVLLFGDYLWATLRDGMMLVLTLASAGLIVGVHRRQQLVPGKPMRGLGWLRSQGRLSYEIYLTHMFVVFSAVAIFRSSGVDMRMGFWWYPPIVALCWALGAPVAHYVSIPCERRLRRYLKKG